jgi:branched-chain amino acid transport system permease protein
MKIQVPRHIWTPFLIVASITAITAAVSVVGGDQERLTLTEMLILMIVVVGIYAFVGNSGIMSFGQIGFMCIGAYAAAWMTAEPAWKQVMLTGLPDFLRNEQYPFLAAVTCGAVLAAAVAFALGSAIMRLSGIAGSIATFAFLAIVNSVYANWETVTAGGSSLIGMPTVVGPWTAWVFAIGAVVLTYAFQHSRYGLTLRASRDDEVAAKSSAIDVIRVRLIAFVFSSALIGTAGGLYAHFLGVLTVETFYLPLTFTTLAMLVVGGIGSLTGAVSGVVVVTAVVELMRAIERGVAIGATTVKLPPYSQEIGLGIVVAMILIFRPTGITRSREIVGPAFVRSKAAKTETI